MRLIDADALIADLEYDVERDAKALDSIDSVGRDWETVWFDKNCKQNAIDLLQRAPTIEPQHRKGKWIEQDDSWDGVYYECSACGEPWTTIDGTPWDNGMNFCPHCGAEMTEKHDGKSD